jgi:predicted dehydrogenase
MSEIGFGIIGTGSIVKTYIQSLREIGDAKLVAMYTKSTGRVDQAKGIFEVAVYDDMQRFLSHSGLDVVCICNESGNHGEAIMESARAGKHVLCEKPLEVTLPKIDEVIEICKKHHVKLGCVLQNRCGSQYMLLEKTVKQGKLGKLLMGNAYINWFRPREYYSESKWKGTLALDGGAAFINQGIHTVDLLLHLMGHVKSVFGNTRTMVHDIEGEDVGAAMLSFASGAIGVVTAGTALYPGYPERLEIYGEKGSVIMEGAEISQWNVPGVPHPEAMNKAGNTSGASDPGNIGSANHTSVLLDMIAAVEQNRPPMITGLESRKAVEVITAIYESSKKGKLIFLPERVARDN